AGFRRELWGDFPEGRGRYVVPGLVAALAVQSPRPLELCLAPLTEQCRSPVAHDRPHPRRESGDVEQRPIEVEGDEVENGHGPRGHGKSTPRRLMLLNHSAVEFTNEVIRRPGVQDGG